MILSISRRTDVPAFYTPWFMNRIKEGYVLARNPVLYNRVSRIELNPETVDFMVFWTKNPTPMIPYLKKIQEVSPFYFQFTLNSYGPEIEPRVGSLESRIEAFQEIVEEFGTERLVWRYDPIFLSDIYTKDWHIEQFRKTAERLWGCTESCVISFIDMYAGVKERTMPYGIRECTEQEMLEIASAFSEIAKENDIQIESCAESVNLRPYGIEHGSCIDARRISRVLGKEIFVKKDSNQRTGCGCVVSVDIGQYNTCRHGCVYCYANRDSSVRNMPAHDATSPLLAGKLSGQDIVAECKTCSIFKGVKGQLSMFDKDQESTTHHLAQGL